MSYRRGSGRLRRFEPDTWHPWKKDEGSRGRPGSSRCFEEDEEPWSVRDRRYDTPFRHSRRERQDRGFWYSRDDMDSDNEWDRHDREGEEWRGRLGQKNERGTREPQGNEREESGGRANPLKICKYYMVNKCKFTDSGTNGCANLHLCRHFVNDECKFGSCCSKNHELRQVREILRNHGITISRHWRDVLREIRHVIARDENIREEKKKVEIQKKMEAQKKMIWRAGSQDGNDTGIKRKNSEHERCPPKLCTFYNVEAGCRNSKSGTSKCPYIHMCKHYVDGSCKFGVGCKRNHNIDEDVKQILEKHGIATDRKPKAILAELREVTRGDDDKIDEPPKKPRLEVRTDRQSVVSKKGAATVTVMASVSVATKTTAPKDTSVDDDTREICLHFLKRSCAFKKSCRKVHRDLPYQWQYKLDSGWNDFDMQQNTDMELKFSDPRIDSCTIGLGTRWSVDFSKMTAKDPMDESVDIRRLSTVSYLDAERQPLATHWLWYWLDQNNKWIQYGRNSAEGYKCPITTDDVEQKYLENSSGQMNFNTSLGFVGVGHQYILDFCKMSQTNNKHNTERKVKRRPTFLSRGDVDVKRNAKLSPSASATTVSPGSVIYMDVSQEAPRLWNLQSYDDVMDHFKIVKVLKNDLSMQAEYKEIKALFRKSISKTSAAVLEVFRIENGELWLNFSRRRAKMTRKLKSTNKDVDERRLFHGTDEKYKDAICRQGFDFRLSGQSCGTMYGKGSYFGTSAVISDGYAGYTQQKFLFVVKALVGEFTTGKSTYVRPPAKDVHDSASELYDCCVDNMFNPTMFVIFDFDKVYPEYIIKYKKK